MKSINLKKAIEFDKKEDLKNATYYYLKAIKKHEELSSNDWLNSGVLFGMLQDHGIKSYHKISDDLQDEAWNTFERCLNNVTHSIEGEFWKDFIWHRFMGEDIDINKIKEMLKHIDTPVLLIIYYDNSDYILEKVKKLLKNCKKNSCERERYINSILSNKVEDIN